MKRWLLAAIAAISALMICAGLGWWWLLNTTAGANWLLARAHGAVPGLSWQAASGDLSDGLVIEAMRLIETDRHLAIGRVELALDVRLLWHRSLVIRRLKLADVDLQLPAGENEQAAPRELVLPDLSSPIAIVVEAIEVERLQVRAVMGDEPLLSVDRMALSGRYDDHLTLDQFALHAQQGELSARGRWQLSTPHRADLSLTANTSLPALPDHRFDARISGPLNDLATTIDSDGPARLTQQATVRGLPGPVRLDLKTTGSVKRWPGLNLSIDEIALHAEAEENDWRLDLGFRAQGENWPLTRVSLDATGTASAVELERLSIETLGGRIQGHGTIALNPELTGRLDVRLSELDLTELYPDWPQQARLNGRLVAAANPDEVWLESLVLQAPPGPMELNGQGRYRIDQDQLDVHVDWRSFAWPPVLDGGQALFSSQQGNAHLSGRLGDWRAEVEAMLQGLNQPSAQIHLEAAGNLEQAELSALELEWGESGSARIHGRGRWLPDPSGQLEVQLERIDSALLHERLPGEVSAKFTLNLDPEQILTLDLLELNGQLRGQTLSGQGRLQAAMDGAESGLLQVQLGDNEVRVESPDGERWAWQASLGALNQIWPDWFGSFNAHGEALPWHSELRAEGTLRSAAFDQVHVESATLTAHLRWSTPTLAQVRIEADQVDLNPWERIENLHIDLDGSCRAHQLDLSLRAGAGRLALAAEGAWPDCLRGGERWSGAVRRLSIDNPSIGQWLLAEPMDWQIGPEFVTAQTACLSSATPQHGRLCLQDLHLGEFSHASIDVQALPMDLVLLPLRPTWQWSSALSGRLAAGWHKDGRIESFAGELNVDAGEIRYSDDEQRLLAIDRIHLDFAQQEPGLQLRINAGLEMNSRIEGIVRLDNLRRPMDGRLAGTIGLELSDVAVFNRFLTQLDQLGGSLDADLEVGGMLRQPIVQGQADWRNGVVVHAPLGIHLDPIDLRLEGDQETLSLSGRIGSGEGHADLSGLIQLNRPEADWQLAIEGQRLTLADASWLHLTATPSLKLQRQGQAILIDGDVSIDRLRAGLPPGQEQRVSASPDVIFENENGGDSESAPTLFLDGRLGIDLGNDARAQALGMQTELHGALELLWQPEQPLPIGRGAVRLANGSYRAYGQNLEINDGQIQFTGHSIDNPRLDIRAVREVFGDPLISEAGVSITGNAREPEIRLFTNPPTSEGKALAYVVTGADFDHAGGQGAVNLGFYLLPRLFVSYGIGLFQSGNILSGRYELSERWGVRLVSGERDTGVDISWLLER